MSARIVRDVLEALCRRDGLSLESDAEPGQPARNYELACRLGIGHVFGLREPDPESGVAAKRDEDDYWAARFCGGDPR